MKKYEEIASGVVSCIGGGENIESVYHCMTRLRFHLKNDAAADVDALKKVKGVIDVTWPSNGELQVIIGTEVDDVYRSLVELACIKEEKPSAASSDLNMEKKQNITPKSVLDSVLKVFSASMNPLVPIFVLVGVFNVVAALIGPGFFNLVSEDSNLYKNFYYVGQAIIYFLPILLAITTSEYFKCNRYLSIVLACIMVYPELITAIEDGAYSVYGIPATAVTYTSSVLPVILTVWIQSYVEKLANKLSPKALKVIMFPFLTVAIMLPLTFCLLGPAGTFIGTGIGSAIVWLRNISGPLAMVIVSGSCAFMAPFGIGRPIFFITLNMLLTDGVEYAYMPVAMVTGNFLAMALALGYAIKNKGEKRQLGTTSFIACVLGGVAEPTWFGIFLPDKKTYLPALIGGIAGGLYLGIMNVGYYQFGPSNFLSVLGFVSAENPSNLVHGIIASAITFVVTFVAMLIFYKQDKMPAEGSNNERS